MTSRGTPTDSELTRPHFGPVLVPRSCSYANSVLQSLYFSRPFRELVESYTPPPSTLPPPSSPSTSVPTSQLSSASASTKPLPSPQFAQLKPAVSKNAGGATAPSPSTPPIRQGMFGLRRTNSTQMASENGESAPPQSPSSGTAFGAPLTQVTTQTSFTGVGTPVVGGTLALDRLASDATLLTTLHDLFCAISNQPKNTGTVAPQAFINQLKKDNEFFRSTLHQDAHEFLNFLVNTIAESLEKEQKAHTSTSATSERGHDAWISCC